MKAGLRAALKVVLAAVDLRDVFAFGGLSAVAYGVAQIHSPSAWIVAGAVVFLLGIRR